MKHRLIGTFGMSAIVAATMITSIPAGARPVPNTAAATRTPLYVALGDSYASGEGTFPGGSDQNAYDAGTNVPHVNECHRSTTEPNHWSYPRYLVAPGWPMHDQRLVDLACSGAVTANVISSGQWNEPSQLSRLRVLVDSASYEVKNISISIGGNDLGFKDILSECVEIALKDAIHGNKLCENSKRFAEPHWSSFEATVLGKMANTWKAVLDTAPGATLFVIGYPNLFAVHPSSSASACPLEAADVRFLSQQIARFDGAISARIAIMRRAGRLVHYVPMYGVFGDQALCGTGGHADINGLELSTVSFPPFHVESFHPTPAGHLAEAVRIMQMFNNGSWSAVDNPDEGISPANGSYLRDPAGTIYRMVGGAPLPLDSCFDGCPGAVAVSGADLQSLPSQVADGTYVRGYETGNIYEIVGGAPLYLNTCLTGCPGVLNVNQWTIDNLFDMKAAPIDGAYLRNDATGVIYEIVGGTPLPLNTCLDGCPGTIDLPSYTVTTQLPKHFPTDGTELRSAETGQYYFYQQDELFAVPNCQACDTVITLPQWTIDRMPQGTALDLSPVETVHLVSGSPATARSGARVTFTVRDLVNISNRGIPGRTVTLYHRLSTTSSWLRVGSATTGPKGGAAIATVVRRSGYWQWRVAAVSRQTMAARSAVRHITVS